MLDTLLNELGEVLLLAAEAAGDEGGAGRQSKGDGIHWRLDVAEWHALGLHADAAGGGGLAGRQAVDLVIHHDIEQVHVSPHGMDEVIATNPETVAVATSDEHCEIVVGHLDAGG